MPVFLNPLAARLAILALTTAAGAVVPVITMDRPVLKFVAGRFGPAIVDAAEERINDHFDVQPQQPVIREPIRYDDGISLATEAVIDIGLEDREEPQYPFRTQTRIFPRFFQNRP